MGEEEGERVTEWERGLPSADDLTPLSQVLIPPGLASAFSISPEPYKTFFDVARASETTFSGLRSGSGFGESVIQLNDDLIGDDDDAEDDGEDDAAEDGDRNRKLRRIDSAESEEKRPRLVWTPQLHKRFVEVVAHLGIKNAVPKTIMQLMNVEGLTRENVASHLQKYRLYLKRMHGGPGGGSSEGSRGRPAPPPSNGNVNRNSNNSSSDGGSNDGYHPRQVAFHPHPGAGMMMQMPMYGDMGGNGGSLSGVGGGGGGSSNHHHHHFHHHQHQFNGYDNVGAGRSGAQSGFDAGFGYHASSYPHRATPSDA